MPSPTSPPASAATAMAAVPAVASTETGLCSPATKHEPQDVLPSSVEPVTDLPVAAPSPDKAAAAAEQPSSPSRRALTYEEFREFYVASKRPDFAQQSRLADPVYHPYEVEQIRAAETVIEQERRRRLAAELCADLAELVQEGHGDNNSRGGGMRRRFHHVMGDLNVQLDIGRAGQAPLASPPPQPGLLRRAGNALSSVAGWAVRQISENIVHLLQFALLGYLVYSQSDEGGIALLIVMGIFAVFAVLRAAVRNFQIGRETGTVSAPSFLGRLFKPEGQTYPVSTPRKIGYMVAKCIEAFLLSIFPTYSIERLEAELRVDGIVQ